MSSYRFCRTDDIALLVDALNRCWLPYFPDEPPTTPVAFKRSIRDLQVWCSSCMVAFSGGDPIGVLIGAKRSSATLVHRIAVHPDHVRQGHGRHLLDSLGSKLAILGPPRIVAEVPDGAAVSAHYAMTAHLAHREDIYQFPNPFRVVLYGPDISKEGTRLDDRADAVEYLVLQVNKSPEDQADFDVIKDAFTLVDSNASWELWQRNRDVPLPPLQPRALIAP